MGAEPVERLDVQRISRPRGVTAPCADERANQVAVVDQLPVEHRPRIFGRDVQHEPKAPDVVEASERGGDGA